jgi:tRNA threonylcarbamoyladenosine biosynthesis protein TsaB
MSILAIDTTSKWCSVAILLDEHTFFTHHENVGNAASQKIFPFIQDVLKQAEISLEEIDYFAVANGPGAFTGIRLGVGVAQGLAFAKGKPLIPISSLDGMVAYSWATSPDIFNSKRFLGAIDARMGQMYCAEYAVQDTSMPVRVTPIYLQDDLLLESPHKVVLGYEINQYSSFSKSFTKSYMSTPHALGVALQARLRENLENYPPEDCQPIYIRDKVAQTTLERITNKQK